MSEDSGVILRRLREKRGKSQEEVADEIGSSQKLVSRHEITGKMSKEWMERYAEYYEVSLDVIAGRQGIPLNGGIRKGQRQIPILGRVACGEPILAMEEAGEYLALPEEILPEGDVIALRMVGDSMQRARLLDGDLALVKVQPAVEDGEIAAVCIGDDRAEATIKRFHRNDGFVTLTPDSDSREHRPQAYYHDQVAIVGKVVGVYWG